MTVAQKVEAQATASWCKQALSAEAKWTLDPRLQKVDLLLYGRSTE
jgi:hypothetical protein